MLVGLRDRNAFSLSSVTQNTSGLRGGIEEIEEQENVTIKYGTLQPCKPPEVGPSDEQTYPPLTPLGEKWGPVGV